MKLRHMKLLRYRKYIDTKEDFETRNLRKSRHDVGNWYTQSSDQKTETDNTLPVSFRKYIDTQVDAETFKYIEKRL